MGLRAVAGGLCNEIIILLYLSTKKSPFRDIPIRKEELLLHDRQSKSRKYTKHLGHTHFLFRLRKFIIFVVLVEKVAF